MSATNWATLEYGAIIVDESSQKDGCSSSNVLDPRLDNIWLTEEGLPQWICISLCNLVKKDICIRTIGWNCWHAWSTNPREVTIHVSADGAKFKIWDNLICSRSTSTAGTSLFCCAPISVAIYPYIALEVTKTYGGSQSNAYINRVYFYTEEIPSSPLSLSRRTDTSHVDTADISHHEGGNSNDVLVLDHSFFANVSTANGRMLHIDDDINDEIDSIEQDQLDLHLQLSPPTSPSNYIATSPESTATATASKINSDSNKDNIYSSSDNSAVDLKMIDQKLSLLLSCFQPVEKSSTATLNSSSSSSSSSSSNDNINSASKVDKHPNEMQESISQINSTLKLLLASSVHGTPLNEIAPKSLDRNTEGAALNISVHGNDHDDDNGGSGGDGVSNGDGDDDDGSASAEYLRSLIDRLHVLLHKKATKEAELAILKSR